MQTVVFIVEIKLWHLLMIGSIAWLVASIATHNSFRYEQSLVNKILTFPFVVILWLPYWVCVFFSGLFKQRRNGESIQKQANKLGCKIIKFGTVWLYISNRRWWQAGNVFLTKVNKS